MPRLLLAGGLDHERAAFAAELADLWNDIPLEYQPYHEPLEVLTPEDIGDIMYAEHPGNWIVQGNTFTRQQAKVVRFASHVVSISFHETQIDGSATYKAINHSRSVVLAAAKRYRKHVDYIYDDAAIAHDAEHAPSWNALTMMADYKRSQGMIDRRVYLGLLRYARWQAQQKTAQ